VRFVVGVRNHAQKTQLFGLRRGIAKVLLQGILGPGRDSAPKSEQKRTDQSGIGEWVLCNGGHHYNKLLGYIRG
jgi:hypothetical protein